MAVWTQNKRALSTQNSSKVYLLYVTPLTAKFFNSNFHPSCYRCERETFAQCNLFFHKRCANVPDGVSSLNQQFCALMILNYNVMKHVSDFNDCRRNVFNDGDNKASGMRVLMSVEKLAGPCFNYRTDIMITMTNLITIRWCHPSLHKTLVYITCVQHQPNVFDVGPTLYKRYANFLCLLGWLSC